MNTLCEVCAKDIGSTRCPQCNEEILRLGPFCYLCGAQLTGETIAEPETIDTDDDFATRILCSDGSCIGVIGENGTCKVCGKPYTPDAD